LHEDLSVTCLLEISRYGLEVAHSDQLIAHSLELAFDIPHSCLLGLLFGDGSTLKDKDFLDFWQKLIGHYNGKLILLFFI
jgi:hypothetical protein